MSGTYYTPRTDVSSEVQKLMDEAFANAMDGRSYGEEETANARNWFESGYLAALNHPNPSR